MSLKKNQISINLLQPALIQSGWKSETVITDDKRYEVFQKGNYTWKTPRAVIDYPFVTKAVRRLAMNKTDSMNFVVSNGGVVPESIELTKEDSVTAATELLKHYPGGLIVKPLDERASHGLTRNITSADDLIKAIKVAHTYSTIALVQQQVSGEELRFTVLDGQVVSVMQKQFAQLRGDGVRPLDVLLQEENDRRAKLHRSVVHYPMISLSQNQDVSTILEDDQVSILKESSLVSQGASVYELLNEVHHSYKMFAQKLATSLSTDFIVIDLLITDWTKPRTNSNWCFLEFNTSPSIPLFYSSRNEKYTNIVELITNKLNRIAADN